MDTNTTDMVLDMANVDFFSLDADESIAVIETKPAKEVKEPEVEEVEEPTEEVSEVDFDSITDEGEPDEEVVEEEVVEEEAKETSEEGEPEEVDYEGYEVTLPNGDTINLAEAVQGYKAAADLEAERKLFEDAKVGFENQSKEVANYLELAKLEADRVIEDYEGFDWAGLAKSDPGAYVDNKEFLEKYQIRQREINDALKTINDKKRADEEVVVQNRARECVTVLTRDIPGWNGDLYTELLHYAVDNGADPEEIKNCVDPMVFKVLYKAKQFEKGKATVTAKIKKAVKSPSKVVHASAKEQTTSVSPQKIQLIKKLETGKADSKDVGNMFAFLED